MAVDYEEDFMQKLIDINFGSGWVIIQIDLKTPPSADDMGLTAAVSFPDTSGGTPGFAGIVNSEFASPAVQCPASITPAMIRGTYNTQAGKALTGFALKGFNLGRGPYNIAWYLKLNDALPKSTFRVRFNYETVPPVQGSGDIEVFTVFTSRNIRPAKGVIAGPFQGQNSKDFVSLAQATTQTFDITKEFDFRVNPSTLQVTGPA